MMLLFSVYSGIIPSPSLFFSPLYYQTYVIHSHTAVCTALVFLAPIFFLACYTHHNSFSYFLSGNVSKFIIT